MRVVVTGASGNVGTSLLRTLTREPAVDSLVGICRRLPRADFMPSVEWWSSDVASSPLSAPFAGADAVVHLAWAIQPGRDQETVRAINVDGSRRVFEAAAAAGAKVLVHASSIGTYAPGPKDRRVDESWPSSGIPSAFYSRHKAAAERLLDDVEARHPEIRCVRLRPGLLFKREAASEIRRLFAGPFLPRALVRPSRLRLIPAVGPLAVQGLHTDDVAEAYRRALLDDGARGAYNVAAEPPLDAHVLARTLGARTVGLPPGAVRAAMDVAFRLRLQPSEPGWLDIALQAPLMDVARVRRELGWEPARSATDALLELLEGMHDGAGLDTAPLQPGGAGVGRLREVASGVGARLG